MLPWQSTSTLLTTTTQTTVSLMMYTTGLAALEDNSASSKPPAVATHLDLVLSRLFVHQADHHSQVHSCCKSLLLALKTSCRITISLCRGRGDKLVEKLRKHAT
jgi:hypothetical protein